MIYRWKPNQHKGVPAQIAGDRIESIRSRLGRVHPGDLVEDARPDDSPLHPCFEWDDSVAAENWRVQEARGVLAALVVVPVEAPESEPVRAFIALGSDNEANDYMPIATVLSDEQLRKQALRAVLEDLNRLKTKYHQLQELRKVWEALDHVTATAAA